MDSPVPSQPQPRSLIVLVTGCSILVELVAHGVDTVTITGLQAEVAGSSEVPFDGVQRTMSAMPDLIGSDDLAEPMRESVTNYRPLDPPHLEVLLDRRPPIVRSAQGSPQAAVEFPLVLRPNGSASFFVAPVTEDARLTSWNLLVDWTVNSTRNTIRWPLTVTGDSGHTTYRPDGTSSSAPITDIAPDHWTPWQPHHGRPWGAEDRLAIAVHGGPSGVQVQHGWGDEERYVAARKSKDHAALLYELLGLTVFVPLMRSDQIPIATVRGDQTFILACTSLPRLRELDAPQVDPEQALALRT